MSFKKGDIVRLTEPDFGDGDMPAEWRDQFAGYRKRGVYTIASESGSSGEKTFWELKEISDVQFAASELELADPD